MAKRSLPTALWAGFEYGAAIVVVIFVLICWPKGKVIHLHEAKPKSEPEEEESS